MYDRDSFDSYHIRMKWDVAALSRGDFKERSEQEAIGFLQAWMYFGLLWDFFGHLETFDLAEFVTQNSIEAKVVTTARLPYYIGLWHQISQEKTAEQRNAHFLETKTSLRSLYLLAMLFCEGVPPGDGRIRSTWRLPLEISLSIQILADTLQHAGYEILKGSYDIDWGYSPLLKEIMQRRGWCPRAIATCTKGQQIHNLCYASTLGRPLVPKTHGLCDEKLCQWEQTDQNTYVTQHRADCPGSCSFLASEEQKLVSTYKANATPLVYFDDAAGADGVKITPALEKTSYTAISHVWGDGLGNQHANALPECQLKHLQKLVDQLQGGNDQGPSYWWCDTLCVPVGPQLKDYRESAIRNMRETYQNAKQVLILDRELMAATLKAPAVELYIRLKLSSWARRLWTLQEAQVSTTPVIQLADGTQSMSQLYNCIIEDGKRDRRFLHTRFSFLARAFFAPFLQSNIGPAIPKRFVDVWKQCQWRNTSHQADEPVCLATITKIDPQPILAVSSKDFSARMVKYWTSLRQIPYALLVQPPPRLPTVGYRWAPSSLLNCFRDSPTNPFRRIPGVGVVKQEGDGLLLKATAVILSSGGDRLFNWDGATFFVSIEGHSSGTMIYRVSLLFLQDQVVMRNTTEAASGKPAIVFLEQNPTGGIGILGDLSGISSDTEYSSIRFVAIVVLGSCPQRDAFQSERLEDRMWLIT